MSDQRHGVAHDPRKSGDECLEAKKSNREGDAIAEMIQTLNDLAETACLAAVPGVAESADGGVGQWSEDVHNFMTDSVSTYF